MYMTTGSYIRSWRTTKKWESNIKKVYQTGNCGRENLLLTQISPGIQTVTVFQAEISATHHATKDVLR